MSHLGQRVCEARIVDALRLPAVSAHGSGLLFNVDGATDRRCLRA